MSAGRSLAEGLARWRRRGVAAAAAGGGALLLGAVFDLDRCLQAYLLAYLFWLAFGLGSLGLVMLHNLTGGGWGFAIRRLLEGAMRTLPWMALLFLPIAVGVGRLYEWADPNAVAADPLLRHKAPYLNAPFFLARAAVYFGVWIGLSRIVLRASSRQDRTGDARFALRLRAVSAPGIALYFVTMTGAAFDWAMSLEPRWFSTIYGVEFVVGQVLTALCFGTICAARLSRREPFSRWLDAGRFHDLGNLVFAFVMLWAYVSFSQFLIIWSGNLPEETPWYHHRLGHGWQAIALALVVFHFALPFAVLLVRRNKRSAAILARIATFLLALRMVDLYWLIAPAFHPDGLRPSWLDLAAPVALGGVWVATFAGALRGKPLLSLHDAGLQGRLEEGAQRA
jgi:hypothetical protein